MKDFFLVRLKLPCAVSKYELSFHMTTVPGAKDLAEHPFKYTIKTSESAPCPLSSLEHAAYFRFGLSPMPAVAQPFGITICSPIDYAIPPVSVYFLVHLHPDCVHSEAVREPTGETPSSLLFRRLRADDEAADQEALLNETIQNSDPFFANGMLDRSACLTQMVQRRNFQDTQRMLLHRPSAVTMDPTVNVLRRLHHGLEWHLGERTQDVPGAMRFDVVVSEGKTLQQRFAYSLQPNLGFPEFFDGVLHLNENDAGSRIELFFSLTVEEEADKAPMKIGEWKAWGSGPRPDRKFLGGEGQPVLAKMSGRNTRMAQWLDYRVRVTISDARMLVGTFMAFDKYMNVVLADCEEFRKIKPAQGPKADPVFCAHG
ncbi:SmB [Symbiodinium sp. CCMP2456]|nr:SmB [Symbiodinium sp. CCMP2456]